MLSAEHLVFDGNRWMARRRSGSGGVMPQARVLQHRTASDISTTSAFDLVSAAPQPAATTPPSASSSGVQDGMETRSRVFARVDNGRVLVIQMKGYHNKQFLTRLVQGRGGRRVSAVKAVQVSPVALPSIKDDVSHARPAVVADHDVDDDDNPNGRGTYSRAYVHRHPQIGWVHRGQGRYLPANVREASKSNQCVLFRLSS